MNNIIFYSLLSVVVIELGVKLIADFSGNEKLENLFEKYGNLLFELWATFFICDFVGLKIATNLCIVVFGFVLRVFIIIKGDKNLNYYFTCLVAIIGLAMFIQ